MQAYYTKTGRGLHLLPFLSFSQEKSKAKLIESCGSVAYDATAFDFIEETALENLGIPADAGISPVESDGEIGINSFAQLVVLSLCRPSPKMVARTMAELREILELHELSGSYHVVQAEAKRIRDELFSQENLRALADTIGVRRNAELLTTQRELFNDADSSEVRLHNCALKYTLMILAARFSENGCWKDYNHEYDSAWDKHHSSQGISRVLQQQVKRLPHKTAVETAYAWYQESLKGIKAI